MIPTALLFDLDETLLADKASTEAALHAAATLAAAATPAIAPDALTRAVWHHAHDLWSAAPTYRYCQAIGISSWEGLWGRFAGDDPDLSLLAAWMPEYQLRVWQHALADQNVYDDALATRLRDTFLATRKTTFIHCAEAETVLRQLHGRFPLAIVTNGAPDLQHAKIMGTGLAQYFDVLVVSGEVGIGKPDARVFHRALDALHVAPTGTVMVGDNIVRDIGGAQRLGMCGVWVNPDGDAAPRHNVTPDHTISTLPELLALLDI